jgi:hypothetical protein
LKGHQTCFKEPFDKPVGDVEKHETTSQSHYHVSPTARVGALQTAPPLEIMEFHVLSPQITIIYPLVKSH